MAYLFDGSNDALSLADVSVTDAFTMAVRANFASLTGDDAVAAAENFPTSPRYAANMPYYTAAGTPGWTSECYVNGTGSTSNATGTGTVSTGTWYALILDRSGTTARAFVDNSQIGSNITVGSGTFTFYNTRLAAHYFSGTNNQFCNVTLADFAIWDVQLDASERAAFGKGYSPLLIRPGNLVRYLPLIRDKIDLVLSETAGTVDAPSVAVHPRVIMPRRRMVGFAGTSPPPPPPSTYIGARYQMIGAQQFSGGRAA